MATVVGNDRYGWIAAALIVGILGVVRKVRGTNQTCAISPPAAADHGVEERPETRRADLPPR